jgi:hypothetical protein
MGKKLRARVAGRARIYLSHDRFPSGFLTQSGVLAAAVGQG